MKIKLFLLILLIMNISCATLNNSVSDAEKEKIKEEVKEVVNTIYKGWEAENFDIVIESCLDSPDFVYNTSGKSYSYKEFIMLYSPEVIDRILSFKITIIDEKYTVLDNSTVLYTTNCKWLVDMKNGNSSLYDPEVMLYIFKKIDSKWRVIYWMESFMVQSVNNRGRIALSINI